MSRSGGDAARLCSSWSPDRPAFVGDPAMHVGDDGDVDAISNDALVSRCDAMVVRVLAWCQRHDCKVAAAESLTGGLLADAFVRIPGASTVFLGSAVTYDVAAKASILHVDADLLRREGAVYPEVARQMARSAAALYAQPDYGDRIIGLATTGVAGPGPDGPKPAGLVYIGVSLPALESSSAARSTWVGELRCSGSRARIRRVTVLRVLQNLSQFTANSQE